jgi:hypothetical protein
MPPAAKHANYYQLHGGGLQVTYSTTGIDGKPHFGYHDALQSLSFSGDQITKEATAIGTLVTVRIRMTIDSGSTTFSVLIPTVNLDLDTSVPISTIGITTNHKFSIIPALRHGQTELYNVTQLTGTASQVEFLVPLPHPEPVASGKA